MHGKLKKYVQKSAKVHIKGTTIEIGSFNVNGSVREVVNIDIGIDIRKGKDVDLVLDACDAVSHFGEESFDNAISTDALEHSKEWKCFIQNMISLVKPGGFLILTAAHPKKGRHDYPNDYWRFDKSMWEKIFSHQEIISHFDIRPSNGVTVRKINNKLDTDFEPFKVK